MPHIKGMIEFDCDFDALAEEMEKSGYVKVVRCGECKHCKRCFVDNNVFYSVCTLNHNKVQGDDWFCADGERREP